MENNSTTPDQNKTTGTQAPYFTDEEMVAWCFGFGVIDILVILSNTLAIIVFTRSKLLRKRTNYFLLCLVIADVMVGVISLPMFLHSLVVYMRGEPVTKALNQVPNAVDAFTGCASIFALTVISLERLYSVALPNWHRTTPNYVYCILITIIWTLAGVLLSVRILEDEELVPNDTMLYFTIVSFFICLVIICFAYVGIWIKVMQRMHEKTKRSLEKDKRLAITLFLVTAIFVLTWLPFQAMNIYIGKSELCRNSCSKEIIIVINLTKLMQYANSFINPIIYTFKMPDFRRVLLGLFGGKSYGVSSTRATSRMLTDRRKRASTLRTSDCEPNGNCENVVWKKKKPFRSLDFYKVDPKRFVEKELEEGNKFWSSLEMRHLETKVQWKL